MENQSEFFEDYEKYRNMLQKDMGNVNTAHTAFTKEVYKDGALSTRVKRLIAMCIAIRIGCEGCMIGQTKRAIEAGATKQEIVEAMQVVLAMGGTPALGSGWRIPKLLDEMGKW